MIIIEMVCEYPGMVRAWEWVRDMDGYSSAFINDTARMPMLSLIPRSLESHLLRHVSSANGICTEYCVKHHSTSSFQTVIVS